MTQLLHLMDHSKPFKNMEQHNHRSANWNKKQILRQTAKIHLRNKFNFWCVHGL